METTNTTQTSTSEKPTVSKAALWTGRVMSTLPVLMLLMSAVMKLMKPPAVVEGFTKFGFPEHLILVIGVIELVCTIVYIIPQTAVIGAILLTGYMGGAIVTHLRAGDPVFIQIIFGIVIWGGIYLRDPRLRKLIPLRS
jgi:uncharacterized membrane protein YphA (DoxX/SURF4 family)